MTTTFRAPLLGAIALTLAGATPSAAVQDLPPAQEVIDRYIEAIGGREAVLADLPSRTTGSFEMPAMGVSGDLEVVSGSGGVMATKITIPGLGEMLTGYTGTVGWSMDAMTGARLLEGGELDSMREQADPLYGVRDASLYTSFETVGEAEYDGEACWEIHFVWKSGREATECYSKDSGLVIAITTSQETPMGNVEVLSRLMDYRQFGDLRLPTAMKQSMMGQEQVMNVSDVQFGDIDLSLLQPPAAIQTLIDAGG